MSFGYSTFHAKGASNHASIDGAVEQESVNPHGLRDALQSGLSSVARKAVDVHPLEISELYHDTQEDRMNYAMLRSTQGIHAPLRLQMEKFLVKQPSRNSVMPSSNLHLDVLNGKDETIDLEDVLNAPEYWEKEVHPHLLLEKRLDASN
ncbi:proteasome maturation protein-like [Paramacrobiotus metropolitanus]|uniref:proteasome maturation protein-like n=1 Tax=Paramacrobiotus metropolitanus TaxID=2943436 RepID=UPI002446465A|nr:proteasome maturation protein-like [Paramacrobiotus metropolitanus]